MSEKFNAYQLSEFAEAFNSLAMQAIQSSPELEDKIQSMDEDDEVQKLSSEIAEFTFVAIGELNQCEAEGGDLDALTESLNVRALNLSERRLKLTQNCLGEQTICNMLPDDQKSEDISASFAAYNAPTFARLFKPR